jgi:hypothetical protein
MRKNPFGKNTLFKIYRHNFQNPTKLGRPVETVKGRANAERRVDMLNEQRSKEEREAGWSYFLA